MAQRITPEKIEQINELYLKLGVKKRVAEIVGCSPSTVSKYIIEGYVSKESRPTYTFEGTVGHFGTQATVDFLNTVDYPISRICSMCILTDEEKADLIELQKEVIF